MLPKKRGAVKIWVGEGVSTDLDAECELDPVS